MRCRIDLFEALWVVVFLKQSLNFVFGFDSTAQTTHVRTTPKRTNLVGLGLGCSLVYLNPQIHFLTTKKQPLKKKYTLWRSDSPEGWSLRWTCSQSPLSGEGKGSNTICPKMIVTWLILPAVICLSKRLSHARLRLTNVN